MNKLLTTYVFICTVIITSSAILYVSDRYQPIGAIIRWNEERVARNERHQYYLYQYNNAVKLVGVDKAEFIKRFCSDMYVDLGNLDPEGEGWAYNGCITNIAEKMAEKCSLAFSVYAHPGADIREYYDNERSANKILFNCD